MNKKAIYIAAAVVVVLVALIVLGISMLYSDKGSAPKPAGDARKTAVSEYPLLQAVPSDAALVAAFPDFLEAVELMEDSTKVFGHVVAGSPASDGDKFPAFIDTLGKTDISYMRGTGAVISHHYSGSMVRMLLLEAKDSAAVSKIISLADSAGLEHDSGSLPGGEPIVRISQSHALLLASKRHLESGMSVLDQSSFPDAAAAGNGKPVLLFCHDYAYRNMLGSFIKPYLGYSSAIGHIAEWSSLAVRGISDRTLMMTGVLSAPANLPSNYANVLRKAVPGEARAADILPSSTVFALSIATDDVASYLDAYRRNQDASEKLAKRDAAASALRDSAGVTPREWCNALDLKEVVRADVLLGKGTVPMLFARIGKMNKDVLEAGLEGKGAVLRPHSNRYAGFLSNLFGPYFSSPDESLAVLRGDWLISGSRGAVDAFFASDTVTYTTLSESGVQPAGKGVNCLAYYSLSMDPSGLERIFSPEMAQDLRETMMGTASEYAILSLEGTSLSFRVERTDMTRELANAAAVKDTVVVVPEGPFKVRNSSTGKTNLFGQASNGAITLSDENGKALWSIPFKGRLCGNVAEVDYYNNGKLQYLFASGSKLYLMDRLGRMVSGFPVDLGKPIALGPVAYDFIGGGAYRAIVVHTDNTVEMYNLHGVKLDGWKGISSPETVKMLPELLDVAGEKYWVIRTSVRTQIYPLLGGDPLVDLSGGKMLRPDTPLTVEGGKVTGTCLDGKERTIKLGKKQ